MDAESPDHTLQPTALVHEAYIRLVDVDRAQRWDGRGHFFAAAAEAMRRILVERARKKLTLRRGGGWKRVDLLELDQAHVEAGEELLALHEALDKLERADQLKADIVKLRYFVGLTIDETAEALDISHATVEKYWRYAKCWLKVELSEDPDSLTTNQTI
jgi:RNA polymerase sigma factor (TIGR02999 family)